MPKGEQTEPWFARLNPLMEIPTLEVTNGEEKEIVCGSRDIAMYGLRLAKQELQDEIYPMHSVETIDEIIDLFYSVDIADVSF